MNNENVFDNIKELSDSNKIDFIPEKTRLVIPTNHAYLLDYDPIENYLYFTECSAPIRRILMSCPKTRGIFRINLNRSIRRKEVINI